MSGLRGNQNLFRPRAEFFYLSSRRETMAVRLSAFAGQPGGKNFRTLRFNHTEDDAHAVTCNISDHAGRHERRPALSYLDVLWSLSDMAFVSGRSSRTDPIE